MNVDLSEQDAEKKSFLNRRYQKDYLKHIFPAGFLGSSSKAVDQQQGSRTTSFNSSRTLDGGSQNNSSLGAGEDLHTKLQYSLTDWAKGNEASYNDADDADDGSQKDSYAHVAGEDVLSHNTSSWSHNLQYSD